jgi:hypothetical protein
MVFNYTEMSLEFKLQEPNSKSQEPNPKNEGLLDFLYTT